jgi:hypothetical protein
MKRIIDITFKSAVAVFLLYAAYGFLTSSSKHSRIITSIEFFDDHATIRLDDSLAYFADFTANSYNRRNMALLYQGKKVWNVKQNGNHYRMSPTKQDSMPLLTHDQYQRLTSIGFTDSDIEYSYNIPRGERNPNPEKSTYGGWVSYGAPSLDVTVLSK